MVWTKQVAANAKVTGLTDWFHCNLLNCKIFFDEIYIFSYRCSWVEDCAHTRTQAVLLMNNDYTTAEVSVSVASLKLSVSNGFIRFFVVSLCLEWLMCSALRPPAAKCAVSTITRTWLSTHCTALVYYGWNLFITHNCLFTLSLFVYSSLMETDFIKFTLSSRDSAFLVVSSTAQWQTTFQRGSTPHLCSVICAFNDAMKSLRVWK